MEARSSTAARATPSSIVRPSLTIVQKVPEVRLHGAAVSSTSITARCSATWPTTTAMAPATEAALPYFNDTAEVEITVVAENIDRGGECPDCAGEVDSQGHNLVAVSLGCGFGSTGDLTGTIASPSNCTGTDQRDCLVLRMETTTAARGVTSARWRFEQLHCLQTSLSPARPRRVRRSRRFGSIVGIVAAAQGEPAYSASQSGPKGGGEGWLNERFLKLRSNLRSCLSSSKSICT